MRELRVKGLRGVLGFALLFAVGGAVCGQGVDGRGRGFLSPAPALAAESPAGRAEEAFVPEGAILLFTREFEEALRRLESEGQALTSARGQELLQAIAVAARYAVRSNLMLVRQNNRIIQLLEALHERGEAPPRRSRR